MKRFALVNHTNPVHWCKNAQDPDHDCVYAICYECKLAYDANNEKSVGKHKRARKCVKKLLTATYENDVFSDSEDEEFKCNHQIDKLEHTCDTLYFTSMYINSIIEQEISFPTKCSVCHMTFSSEKMNFNKN